MYIDIDDCDENRDVNIPSCIRDVRFACRNSFDQYNVSKVSPQLRFCGLFLEYCGSLTCHLVTLDPVYNASLGQTPIGHADKDQLHHHIRCK